MTVALRVFELALENLEHRKEQVEADITALRTRLQALMGSRTDVPQPRRRTIPARRKDSPRFSEEERMRRSQRMKAYWEKWREERSRLK